MDWLSQLFGGGAMGAPQSFEAPSLGASIQGGPSIYNAPIGPTVPGPAMGASLPPQAAPQAQGAGLLNALRGVKMPEAPQAQRVATPHAPAQRAIGSGNELVQLLMSLGIGPKDIPGTYRGPGR